MLDRIVNISFFAIDWRSSIPVLRYVLGSCFILGVTSLLNYDLAYLTPVLALGYIAPGSRPLGVKKGVGFVLFLAIITGLAVVFTDLFLAYALVFMPLLILILLWIYYSDKLPITVKLFSLISLIVIPFVSIDSGLIGSFVASKLVLNGFMAVALSQIVFWVFPICEADLPFEKKQDEVKEQSENERLRYGLNIMIIIVPVLLLFYMFKLSSSMLVLIFIAILSMSPALSNPKVGLVMIVANVLGGIFGIIAYNLLVMVPNFVFMMLVTLSVGLFFGNRLFSDRKTAGIYGSGYSTFLLILGSVTASDAEAGDEVWSRLIQISAAVIYVVVAFGILEKLEKVKKKEET